MLVERINRYQNKGLKIMTNERDSVRVALEAILLLLYAWNSAPIPGTDLSRCFVALGCEFPIDFSANKHIELISTPAYMTSYSRDLASRLAALQEVVKLLIEEQRAYHREFINSRRPDPKIYSIRDTIFARRATWSDAGQGQVDKLTYTFTGPWLVTAKLDGASYEIEHVSTKRKDKKHASDLTPYPAELIAFKPLDGADNQYGQLNPKLSKHPHREAGIKWFTPPTPFLVPVNFVCAENLLAFHWPTLFELNDELFPYPWSPGEMDDYTSIDSTLTAPGFYTGPLPSAPQCLAPSIPPSAVLAQLIIRSSDRLFFISNSIGSGNSQEWRLIRVAFDMSMASYPSCLINGRYLVDFYISHPSDSRYNAINKRFWLQYHDRDDTLLGSTTANTHLIRPSDTSKSYASRHNLIPYRKYINLIHLDTYIHGPFEFATINHRKSRDRICQSDWDVLKSHCDLFHNPLPSFDVPTYSVHVDAGAHTTFFCATLSSELASSALRDTPPPPVTTRH